LITATLKVNSPEAATPMGAKKEKVTITVYTCERCGARWCPRDPFGPIPVKLPGTCVRCKSKLWQEKPAQPDK
jgi:hypothetical protein